MNDLNVIDRFLQTFIRYIDSGFGLLGGDVAFTEATPQRRSKLDLPTGLKR
jgi:type IV secretion system protein TrbL